MHGSKNELLLQIGFFWKAIIVGLFLKWNTINPSCAVMSLQKKMQNDKADLNK